MTRRERRATQTTRRSTGSEKARQPGIVFVCTGNICRSALADVVLRAHVSGFEIASAGTQAMTGHGMTAEQHQFALVRGARPADVEAHRAQQLLEPLVQSSDLVLGMTPEHRRYAMRLVPGHLDRIFTALEFARLAALLPDAELHETAEQAGTDPRRRLDAVVARIASLREPGDVDGEVIDPYRQSLAVYEQSAAQLDPVLDQVHRVLWFTAPWSTDATT